MGVPGAVLWALMTFLLSFLPLVGAALIWAPVAIWLALSGHLVKGVVLALIGLLVLGNVDNVVRPLLLSGKGKINTLVLIISLMGGVSAFGFIGIVLGPLVAVLLTAIIESYASRSDDDLFASVAPRPLPAGGRRSHRRRRCPGRRSRRRRRCPGPRPRRRSSARRAGDGERRAAPPPSRLTPAASAPAARRRPRPRARGERA